MAGDVPETTTVLGNWGCFYNSQLIMVECTCTYIILYTYIHILGHVGYASLKFYAVEGAQVGL